MKNIIYSSFLVVLLAMTFACQKKAAPAPGSNETGSKGDTGAPTISEDVILLEGGKTKLHSGDNKGAIDELNKSIESQPQNAEAYYWRAVAKCYLGDNTGCCEDYTKAAKLGHPSAAEMVEKYCKK